MTTTFMSSVSFSHQPEPEDIDSAIVAVRRKATRLGHKPVGLGQPHEPFRTQPPPDERWTVFVTVQVAANECHD
jgi:hypothetical protein